MWNRKEIKQATRKNMKLNYWACIVVCFLMLLFSIEYATSDTFLGSSVDSNQTTTDVSQEYKANVNGGELAKDIFDEKTDNIDNEKALSQAKGAIAALARGVTSVSSAITFAGDMIQKIATRQPVLYVIISLFGILIAILFYMFFQAQLIVGERRFFMENRLYHDTRIIRLFSTYSDKNDVWNIAKIMFLRGFFWFLWCLTIVGGFIKEYEYRQIPYILAENPGISRKECFALSKKMAYGQKWNMFKFDASYILWFLLGLLTLGLLNVFYLNPYYRGGQAEIYTVLRENAEKEKIENIELLNDADLFTHSTVELPADVYPTAKIREKHELSVPWNRKYSVLNLILIFFTFAMIGWLWEVGLHFFRDGVLVNRGSTWGPWLPIYGIGGALVVVLLKPLGKKPWLLALVTFVACGILEYTTAWYCETYQHVKFWDYSHNLFNLHGRICLEGLIMFTVLASLGLYIIGPRLDELFNKWPDSVKMTIACILVVAFVGDMILTKFYPHRGSGISSNSESMMIEETVLSKKV